MLFRAIPSAARAARAYATAAAPGTNKFVADRIATKAHARGSSLASGPYGLDR